MNTLPERYEKAAPDRWQLIRDVAVLQVKLIVDGFRDLILVPASLVAGVVSLIDGENGRPGTHFYRLLSLGKQSERWINLFGALDNAPPGLGAEDRLGEENIDRVVSRIEAYVVEEYRRGGVTAQAKARLDEVLDRIQHATNRDGEDRDAAGGDTP